MDGASSPPIERKGSATKSSPPAATTSTAEAKLPREPKFPTHNAPRVWFLTAAHTPIGISLARHLLAHGDYICAGVSPSCFPTSSPAQGTGSSPVGQQDQSADFQQFLADVSAHPQWRFRLRVVALDVRLLGQCQSAIAEAVRGFGRVDILFCCGSSCAVGAVEELACSEAAKMGVRDMFDVNFFGAVNVIKAMLPTFRAKRNGHIIVLTGITGHLGTPGLGLYCASQWAIEGYCDSLAYEVAPFNIRTTIVQPNMEIPVLTNKIVSAPPMGAYSAETNGAPLFRDILSGLLDRLEHGGPEDSVRSGSGDDGSDYGRGPSTGDLLHQERMATLYAPLSRPFKDKLVAETVYAVAAIGGHDNPPSRHIVGHEGVNTVKEKLKTVSEELEDFVEVSAAVDIGKDDMPFVALV